MSIFDDVENFNVMDVALDSPTSHNLEVDLKYPQHLHDIHADLPFCPRNHLISKKTSSSLRCKKPLSCNNVRIVSASQRSIIYCNLCNLRDFVNTNSTQILELERITNLRKIYTNEQRGKTMENVYNYIDVRLLTHWDGRYGAEAMIAKSNFRSRNIFSENLIAIEMRKLEIQQTDIHKYVHPRYI